jgi:hypothetical protein
LIDVKPEIRCSVCGAVASMDHTWGTGGNVVRAFCDDHWVEFHTFGFDLTVLLHAIENNRCGIKTRLRQAFLE